MTFPDPWAWGVYMPWAALLFIWTPWFIWRVRTMGLWEFCTNRPAVIMSIAMVLLLWVWTDIQMDWFTLGDSSSNARAWAFALLLGGFPIWDIWSERRRR